jgi:hypothetical protein
VDVVYTKAGNIELVRYRDNKRFLKAGVVQSIAFSSNIESATMLDGNSAFDRLYRTGFSPKVDITLNSFQQKLYSAITDLRETEPDSIAAPVLTMGGLMSEEELLDCGTMRVIGEYRVPPGKRNSITLPRTPFSPRDIVVCDEENEPLAYTEDYPAEGYFRPAGRELFFNASAVGKMFVVAYDATGVDVDRSQMDDRMSNDIFRLTITGEAILRNGKRTAVFDALTFDRVMAVNEIAAPARQKEPQGWRFTMQVLSPRSGRCAVDFVIQN